MTKRGWVAAIAGLSLAAHVGAKAAETPRFESYPVAEIFTGTPAKIDVNNVRAFRSHRSDLRRAQEKGANFAGRYTAVSWNCGNRCSQLVVLDTQTGKVAGELQAVYGVGYRRDSSLLVVDPPESIPPRDRKTHTRYYRWSAGAFEEITPPKP